jgi:hypothetical protein
MVFCYSNLSYNTLTWTSWDAYYDKFTLDKAAGPHFPNESD